MNTVFLLLGSNLGDKEALLIKALHLIEKQAGTIIQQSAFYETESWGFEAESTFYNQAVEVQTKLTAEEVLQETQQIESQLGRIRLAEQYTSRTIDIDLLLYNQDRVSSPHLEVPHPRMHLRRFCLEPLCEIAPKEVHPIFRKSIIELLSECKDACWVKRVPIRREL